ncbi:MAG: IS5/IS1182 family transposase, partial [Marinovum sp.]|nr:IS5/IS1182 family transposase [Marinovum sp.]
MFWINVFQNQEDNVSDHFWLCEEELRRIKSHFPLSHGVPRVDDRKVVSGII